MKIKTHTTDKFKRTVFHWQAGVGQAVEETVVTPAAAQTGFNIRVLLNTKFLIIICTSITITLRYLHLLSD
jgi:hypothetical protein